LPRRLGDDPLARAKNAKKSGASPQARVAQSQSSNDVFFQRRGVEEAAPGPQESPEISEISEIPAIREAAAAPTEVTAPAPAPIEAVSQPPATTSFIEEVVTKFNETAPSTAPPSAPTSIEASVAEAQVEGSGSLLRRFISALK
jgi:hypothetical protein